MDVDCRERMARLPDDRVYLVTELFRMLADDTRVQILWSLADSECSVNELAVALAKPAATVSQHLAKLRGARLVRTRRLGNRVIYRLESDHVRRVVIDAVLNAAHACLDHPSYYRIRDNAQHPRRGLGPTRGGADPRQKSM